MKYVLPYALGEEDYTKYFDYISVDAQKPSFWNNPDKQFIEYVPNTDEKKYKGATLKGKDFDFDKNRMWFHGNTNPMLAHIAKDIGKDVKDVRGVYFGDNPKGDVRANKHANWDCAFIYEEIDEVRHPDTATKYFQLESVYGDPRIGKTIDGKEVNTYLYGKCLNDYNHFFSNVESEECLEFLTKGL